MNSWPLWLALSPRGPRVSDVHLFCSEDSDYEREGSEEGQDEEEGAEEEEEGEEDGEDASIGNKRGRRV